MRAPDAKMGTPERDVMNLDLSETTLAWLKTRAQNLQRESAEQDTPLSRAQALEQVAHQDGARDWNTRRALALRPVQLRLGDRVEGRYLNQPFVGHVRGLTQLAKHLRLDLQFEAPVDVVQFDSFSAWRRRVQAVVARNGRSPRCTSDGVPHMILEAWHG